MNTQLKQTIEKTNITKENFLSEVASTHSPVIMRGLIKDWESVKQCTSPIKTAEYFKSLYNQNPVQAFVSAPDTEGRFYYNDQYNGFNFSQHTGKLDQILDKVVSEIDNPSAPCMYVGSTPTNRAIPSFTKLNPMPLIAEDITPRLWIGNKTRISAHYDIPDNIACVVSGKRRFTLFPPEQVGNLYVGPLEFTPAGQSLSLVDFKNPDFDKFPKFEEALKHAEVAELEPGDALYLPSMWWHHVEGLGKLNTLINYWWNDNANYLASPFEALMLSLMSIKELPQHQKDAWKAIFDHYIFQTNGDPVPHLPDEAKGIAGPLDIDKARIIRSRLIGTLNR